MIKLQSSEELNKIFGNIIMQQLELPKSHVLNGKSLYGVNRETIDNYITKTFTEDDSYVVFLVEAQATSDDITEDTDDTEIIVYSSYTCVAMCYGVYHDKLALQLKSRLLTEEVLAQLRSKGVHVQSIDVSNCYSEFINDMLINRRDVSIHVSCQIDMSKIDNEDDMTVLNDTFEIETV